MLGMLAGYAGGAATTEATLEKEEYELGVLNARATGPGAKEEPTPERRTRLARHVLLGEKRILLRALAVLKAW